MGNISRSIWSIVSFVLMLLFCTNVTKADVTGSILGVVRDRSQGVVAGAKIRVTNVETNLSQEATSDADGSYHFLALPAGKYKVTASAAGFRPFAATDITLEVNDQYKLDITLDVGTVAEEVSVAANAV